MSGKVDKKIRQYVRRNMVLVSQEIIAGMRNLEFRKRWTLAWRILWGKVIDAEKTLFSQADMEAAQETLDEANKALKEANDNLGQARAMIWAFAKSQGGEIKVTIELLEMAQTGQVEFKHNEMSAHVTVTAK